MASSAALDTPPGARLQGREVAQGLGERGAGRRAGVRGASGPWEARQEPAGGALPQRPPPHPPWVNDGRAGQLRPAARGKVTPGHEAAAEAGGAEGREGGGPGDRAGPSARTGARIGCLCGARADQRAPRPAPVRITPRSRGAAPAGSAAQVLHGHGVVCAPRYGRRRVRVPRLPSPRPGFIFRHRVLS